MVAFRKLISERFPKIKTYGCSAHYLNLVEQAVTPNSVIKCVVEINKFFRNHHNAHGWLSQKGGLSPQLPNDTRWNSQVDCLESFVKNYQNYLQIPREHKYEIHLSYILI